jgi:putative nucleotidyltransferase with HDIG domain
MFSAEKRRRPIVRGELARTLENGGRFGPWREIWPQLVALLVTGIAVTWLIAGSGEVFPYRVGQVVRHEIRLRVDLQIPDELQTRTKREEEARNSPAAYIHDPAELKRLYERISALLAALAQQPEFTKLDPSLVATWELTAQSVVPLREITANETALPAVTRRLEQVFQPLFDYGVLDDAKAPADRSGESERIETQAVDTPEKLRRLARIDDVLLSRLSRVDGPLAERIRKHFPETAHANALFGLIAPRLVGTLTFDEQRTRRNKQLAQERIDTVYVRYPQGSQVVDAGTAITPEQLRLLRHEHEQYQAQWRQRTPWYRALLYYLGLATVVLSLLGAIAWYFAAYEPELVHHRGRVFVLCGLAIVTIALTRIAAIEPYHAEVLPIAIASMFLAVAFDRAIGLIGAFALSLLAAMLDATPMQQFLMLLGGTAVGVLVLNNVRSRSKLIVVGFLTAVAYGLLSIALDCLTFQPWNLMFIDALRRSAAGLIAGFFISGCLPFIESLFGIVTDISLIELADTSHPLLKELVRRAPGTYNHSVTVSILGEAAAKAIGCNALLVRVGALFHDVGKMLKAHYFVENMSEKDRNRHEQLAPAMSTLIIIGHVKDGTDLARQYHLPQPIIDMIEQHHGTTLVDFFYREATRALRDTREPDETVEESAYRYPGPKPQTKESAVLMLADCVESASRVLSEPTPASLEKLVHTLALNRLLDGQFDAAGITLRELRMIEDSLTKSMTSVYHGRIRYPEAV